MTKSISQLNSIANRNGSERVYVSRLSDTVTITDTSISALAADNSLNDANGNFNTIGLLEGHRVKITGFTSTANNIESAVVTEITANKITFGGTDGDVIVDEIAGNSITITKWESVSGDYIPDDVNRSVDTLADLPSALLSVDVGKSVYVNGRNSFGDGYQGWFFRTSTDYSSEVLVDTQQAIYIDLLDGTYGVRSYGQAFDSTPLAKMSWFGAKADKVTNDSVAVQAAFDSDANLQITSGQYRVIDVVLRKQKYIQWDMGATFKPIGAGSFVLKVDGSINPTEESAIKLRINRIEIDGGARAFAVDGLHLKSLLRSEIGDIVVNRVAERGVYFVNSVKETTINTIRTHDCGSTTSVGNYIPAVDMRELTLSGDAHNNIFINNFYGVYNRGPDFVVDSASGRSTNPRKITINNYMIHGHIEASDPAGNPLTTAEKEERKQIIIGSADDIVFGVGSVQFAALNTHAIHITAGSNGSAGRVEFSRLVMNNRYDFAGAATQNTGIRQDSGTLVIKGFDGGNGYSGFDVIFSGTGTNCYINPIDFNAQTGTVTISDSQEVFVRKQNWNFGGGDINNLKTLRGGAGELDIREGQSGSDMLAMGVKSGDNSGHAITTNYGVLAFNVFTYPTKGDLSLDGIGAALLTDGSTLRFFDGTDYYSVDLTLVP